MLKSTPIFALLREAHKKESEIMRRLSLLAGVAVCLALAAGAMAGEHAGDKAWFDAEGCAMCSNMAAEDKLLDHMSWETHLLANGMLTVTTIDPEYAEAFARAHKNMEKTGAKLMAGEQMNLCGFCMSMGGLFMSGAKMQNVETKAGHIGIITSDNEEVVSKIHEHAERTIKETKAMEKGE